jgi:hypothetical protein
MTHPACAADDLATPAAQLWNSKSLFDLLPGALLARQCVLKDGIDDCCTPKAGLGFGLVEQLHLRRFPASLSSNFVPANVEQGRAGSNISSAKKRWR